MTIEDPLPLFGYSTKALVGALTTSVRDYMDADDGATVRRATDAAFDAHQDRDERLDGTPYIDHALRVALTMTEWHAPVSVVVAAILHDVLKPKYSRHPEAGRVESEFGSDVAILVSAASQLGRMGWRALQAPPDGADIDIGFVVRTLPWVVGMLGKSPYAVLIKLADRLDNFDSLGVIDPIRRKGFASATLRVFVPCADWLGMWDVKRRLEDAAFAVLQPEAYERVRSRYGPANGAASVGGFGAALAEELERRGLAARVEYIARSAHSLYRDEVRQGGGQLPKQIARPLLVLVNDESQCYEALAAAHRLWPAAPRSQEDYISAPKPNGYRSLHTVVETASGHLPVRIRSRAMHLVAEWGIAAAWRGAPDEWMPRLPKADNAPPGMIAVYSTAGEVQILGEGATPVDFALARGEEYGMRCVQATVNERPVTLDHKLSDGDVVRIFTADADAGSPDRLWRYVNLPESRDKLRRASGRESEHEAATRGWKEIAARLGRLGLSWAPSQVNELLRTVAAILDHGTADDLLAAVDRGEISAGMVAGYMRESAGGRHRGHGPRAQVTSLGSARRELDYAGCCNPAPPDEIVAYASRPKCLVIHRADCGNVRRPDRVVPAQWEEVPWQKMVAIELVATDRLGLIHDIAGVMTEEGVCMSAIHADQKDDGSADIFIGLGDLPTDQLRDILVRLRGVTGVRRATRCGPNVPSVMAADGVLAKYVANPYTLKPISGRGFCGREADMQKLLDGLRRLGPSESVLLWGSRRIGKTSLLRQFAQTVLSAQGYAPIIVDLQQLAGDTVAGFLAFTVQKVVDALQNPNVVAPTPAEMQADPLTQFKRVMHSADDFDPRQIVLMFDEFEKLSELRCDRVEIANVMSYMRSLMLEGASFSFVFCGGGALQTLLDHAAASTLFNVTRHQRVGCLDEQAARQLVMEPVTRVTFNQAAVARLLSVTACHPFYLQLLCSQLLEEADSQQCGEVKRSHVDALMRKWVPRLPAHYFDHFWGEQTAMSPADKAVNRAVLLSILTRARTTGWTSISDIMPLGEEAPGEQALERSLMALRDLDAIVRTDDQVRLPIPLVREWLTTNMLLRDPRAPREPL